MPPAQRIQYQQEGKNQNTTRSPLVVFDQHRDKRFPNGRPWIGTTEIPADAGGARGIIGELLPISAPMEVDGVVLPGWDAPWVPEAKYVTMAIGTMTAGNRIRFDYERMAADRRAANVTYYTLAAKTAAERNLPVPQLSGPVSFQLRAIVGNPPKSPKLPEAAAAGDPWLLGFTEKVNEQLYEILLDEQGRSAEFLAREDEAPAAKPSSFLEQVMNLTDAEKQNLAALLAPKSAKPTKAMPDAA